ncbi:B-cell receptor CD22-like [Scomber japonicus]|uniref:B-cell receptor CD22-like n=1 Tax=Scomber japonicus TaxID=13676 RepID=UPI002305739B|nr:B-cell receptor CD22-like [Scomber japonicus]
MAVWDKQIPWIFMLLLAGAAAVAVNYPEPVCAVRGSTVVLPCTFTPRSSFTQDGRQVPLKVIRVLWCVNHEICDDITSSVYDSASPTANPRYKYLGDMTGNCTLQISNIQMNDSATFRFRMEADDRAGHYIDQSGVNVTVTDFVKMRIQSSRAAGELSRFQQVTLNCSTSICNIHQLEVTWFKDGNALPKSGPTLQLGPLTAKDSGNYTCALKTGQRSTSLPFTVRVEEEDEGLNHDKLLLIVRVVLFTLLTLLIVIVTAVIIKRYSNLTSMSMVKARGEMVQLAIMPCSRRCHAVVKSAVIKHSCTSWK